MATLDVALQIFHDAELTDMQSRTGFILDGDEWITDTVHSLLPKLEATGVARAKYLNVDTLAERLEKRGSGGGTLCGRSGNGRRLRAPALNCFASCGG
jgi:hypothetical protein